MGHELWYIYAMEYCAAVLKVWSRCTDTGGNMSKICKWEKQGDNQYVPTLHTRWGYTNMLAYTWNNCRWIHKRDEQWVGLGVGDLTLYLMPLWTA